MGNTGTQAGQLVFGSGLGSDRANRLLSGALDTSTQSQYQSAWTRFVYFYKTARCVPLPATDVTVR